MGYDGGGSPDRVAKLRIAKTIEQLPSERIDHRNVYTLVQEGVEKIERRASRVLRLPTDGSWKRQRVSPSVKDIRSRWSKETHVATGDRCWISSLTDVDILIHGGDHAV